MRASAAGVYNNLMSASQLVDAGNEVIFRPDGAFHKHLRLGRLMRLTRRSGVFEPEVALEPVAGFDGPMCRAVIDTRSPV